MGCWVKKGKGLRKIKQKVIDTDNPRVVPRRKGEVGWVIKGKSGQIHGDGRSGFGWWELNAIGRSRIIDCTIETYIILLTNVTLINLKIKHAFSEAHSLLLPLVSDAVSQARTWWAPSTLLFFSPGEEFSVLNRLPI